ncbi:MAG: glycosyltransferase family 4 protein, partial [Chloroflexi bacterium]|nr:glycosyltransferase family 4 protein [Chloroflexota bacterium]
MIYHRPNGGISTYTRRLVAALERLDHDHRYTVLHSRRGRESVVTRFRHGVVWTPAHHRLERIALAAELARFRLDVLHTTDFIPPWRGARRHIASIHDLTFLHYPQFLTAESRRYYNDQIVWAARHADHILTISVASKQDLISMLNVPPEKITVQLLAAEPHFRPLPPERRDQHRVALNLPERYVLFVGTLEPRKNIGGLIEAYRFLLDQLPDAPPVVIVGQLGWLFAETRARIEALQLGDRVIWRDDIDNDALPALYALADTLVLPSFYEGFGLPALEAMACG